VTVVADRPHAAGIESLSGAEPVFATVPAAAVAVAPAPTLDVPERAVRLRDAARGYEELEDDADERLPWWPLLVLVLLVAGVVAGAIVLTSERSAIASPEVPDVVGLSFDDLDAAIAGHGWQVNRLETRMNGSVAGQIVSQNPEGGTALDKGDVFTVTVSLGNEMVEIPSDIVGLTVDQAASRLGSVGLVLGALTEENNEGLEAGLVIGLAEPTTQKPAGETVSLRVSLGPTARVVPETVIGMNIAEATEVLTGLRLQAVEEPVYDPAAAVGTVLGSEPAPGEAVDADSQVTLLVSAGPEPVEMPDVEGLALDEAIDAIEALGLVFIDSEGTPGELAIGTDPPAGEIVDVGTEVVIILDEPSDATDEG
jgi:serine/threonine-protein kinase